MLQLLLPVIYLAFISLGLPDAVLGAAWPSMHQEFGVPISYAGAVSMIISAGTIVSSLQSDRLTRRWGTGKVTAFSVAITAVSLFGFSMTRSFWLLCAWAVPYGLGAGSVDASINNYVALHYKSRHMSWLHCMWGVGATAGPYVMGWALAGGGQWYDGYRVLGIFQIALTAVLFFTLPMWKENDKSAGQNPDASPEKTGAGKPLTLKEIFGIPGAREILICFLCYSAVEQSVSLWASTYLALARGVAAETAARYAGMFFIGITVGRGISGFLTMEIDDENMIRLGQVLIAAGIACLLIPGPQALALLGLVVIGLGCAPIYPCIIHSTPAHFGADKSQAVIGVQMAFAYIGSCLMPPLFGLAANHITPALLPGYLLALLALMAAMHELLMKRAPGTKRQL